jgi:hypothetical protein
MRRKDSVADRREGKTLGIESERDVNGDREKHKEAEGV